MKFSLFSAVLVSIGWMSVVVTGDYRPRTCCLTVSDTRVPAENIVNYEMQEPPICPRRAVRFHTKKNITICSDPDSQYAKRVIKIVDLRRTTKPMCYTSTTNTIPTVTTTNKTPGTQTETSTSTTASRIVTTSETSRPQTEITKTTNQPTSVSKENPESSLSTATTCGTGGPTSPSTEKRHETPGKSTVTHQATFTTTNNTRTASSVINKTSPTTKLSKLIIRKRGKSKNRLRKFQMGTHKNKPGKN